MRTTFIFRTGAPGLFAVTIDNGAVIGEGSLGRFPYQETEESIAYAPDGYVYYTHFGGGCDILRAHFDTPTELPDGHYGGELVYQHWTQIGDLQVRPIGVDNDFRIYFTGYTGQSNTFTLYYLDGQHQPVPYKDPSGSALTLSGTDLQVPFTGCGGIPDAYLVWDGTFAFGESPPALYLCTGPGPVGGLFRMSDAGLDQVTGPLEQLHVVGDRSIRYPVCVGGSVYYTSSADNPPYWAVYQFDLATSQETLVYTPDEAILDMTLMPELLASWEPPEGWQLATEWERVRVVEERVTTTPPLTVPQPGHTPGPYPDWSYAVERLTTERVVARRRSSRSRARRTI